jgi:hypothetical protein
MSEYFQNVAIPALTPEEINFYFSETGNIYLTQRRAKKLI